MSRSNLSERELLILIEGERYAELSTIDLKRLEQALREDPLAQELYQNYKMLDAELYWRQIGPADSLPWSKNPSGLTGNPDSILPLLMVEPDFGKLFSPLPVNPSELTGTEPVECEAAEVEALLRSERTRSTRKLPVVPSRRLFETGGWMDIVPWRLVGTCVFCLALVAAMVLDLRPRDQHEVTVKAPPTQLPERYLPVAPVATLISTIDCRWQDRQVPLESGSSVYYERLELLSGTAKLLFGDGAWVILEGPASLMIQDTGRVVLEHGKVAVQVSKRAIGFTVATPTVEVVDFGTEFGVSVSKEGLVEAAVLVGKVEVGALGLANGYDTKAGKQKRVVTAGQAIAARVDANHVAIDSVDFNEVLKASFAKSFALLAQLPTRSVAYGVPDRTPGDRVDFEGGVGLDFEVKSPVRILSLGVFDHLSDGIDPSTRPTVQLWSRDVCGTPNDTSDDTGREILASQTFMAGEPGELRLGHRLKPLAKSIELPVGSYSVVAYGLANKNPFVGALTDFWQSGSVIAPSVAVAKGLAGGRFARNDHESYFGDTNLNELFTLNSAIAASGNFVFFGVEELHHGKFFVGHFSQSTANDRREFIGVEFARGQFANIMSVRARVNRFNGSTPDDAYSNYVNLVGEGSPFHFDYIYDPNFEADSDHAGPEGRLTLRIYNDALTVDETTYAINSGTHRDDDSVFDSFGMGIAAMESMEGSDPNSTSTLLIDDVTYSGHKGIVDFNTDPGWKSAGNEADGNCYGWVDGAGTNKLSQTIFQMQGNPENMPIIAVGSRSGECRPGIFPATLNAKKIGFAAGTFEYIPQRSSQVEVGRH